jgi:hypothetical protein
MIILHMVIMKSLVHKKIHAWDIHDKGQNDASL